MLKYRLIKDLREDNDYTQNDVAKYLKVNRSTYASWENGDNYIPLRIVDKLSLLYNVPLSFLLGVSNHKKCKSIKPMNYENVLYSFNKIKGEKKYSYQRISDQIGVSKSNCYKYYKGIYDMPTNVFISLCEFNNVDIDEICEKV